MGAEYMGVLVQTNNMMTPTSTPPATPRAPVWQPKAPTKKMGFDRLELQPCGDDGDLTPTNSPPGSPRVCKTPEAFQTNVPVNNQALDWSWNHDNLEQEHTQEALQQLFLSWTQKTYREKGFRVVTRCNVAVSNILSKAVEDGDQVCPETVAKELRDFDSVNLQELADKVYNVLKTKARKRVKK